MSRWRGELSPQSTGYVKGEKAHPVGDTLGLGDNLFVFWGYQGIEQRAIRDRPGSVYSYPGELDPAFINGASVVRSRCWYFAHLATDQTPRRLAHSRIVFGFYPGARLGIG